MKVNRTWRKKQLSMYIWYNSVSQNGPNWMVIGGGNSSHISNFIFLERARRVLRSRSLRNIKCFKEFQHTLWPGLGNQQCCPIFFLGEEFGKWMEHILNLREFQYFSSMTCWDLVFGNHHCCWPDMNMTILQGEHHHSSQWLGRSGHIFRALHASRTQIVVLARFHIPSLSSNSKTQPSVWPFGVSHFNE